MKPGRSLNRRSFLATIVGGTTLTVLASPAAAFQDNDSGPGADPLGRAPAAPPNAPDERRVPATRGFQLSRPAARPRAAAPSSAPARRTPADPQQAACRSLQEREAALESQAEPTAEVASELERIRQFFESSC